MSKRMYIIVNRKLSKSQRIPQSCHAVAEFMKEHGQMDSVLDWIENDKTMVCLQTDIIGINELIEIYGAKYGYKYATFRDSDLDDMMTALVFEPMEREVGNEYMGSLRLA